MKYDYLVIAEKKTLAEDIAKAFREHKNCGYYFLARDERIGTAKVFWLFGHVLEVDIDKTFELAGYPERFPVFPERLIKVITVKRRDLVRRLGEEIKSNNWRYVVNAGDPDREGELLVREVLEYFRVPKKRVLRLWFNSQESLALRKAFEEIKPIEHYDHVYVAGLARQIGDFWFGINGSRSLHKATGNKKLSIGRVQIPVLGLVVKRHLEIQNFKPEEYYVVWIVVKKDGKSVKASFVKKTEGLLKRDEANKIYQAVRSQRRAQVKKVEKKKYRVLPPNLYVLSSLIKDAGKFKFSAQKTLAIVQRLYEHYKCISYPRTESCYLATADRPNVVRYLKRLGYSEFIDKIPDRIFNDKDVAEAGHHAIIPIDKLPSEATKEEKLIYDLILKRFLSQFYSPYEYEKTTVVFDCGGYEFRAVGKVDLVLGWKELYKGYREEDEEEKKEGQEKELFQNLPVFKENEWVNKVGEEVEKRYTQPPPYYTSSSLVNEMKRYGLGTEATRPHYESVLLSRGYILRDKKNRLFPTEAGLRLIECLESLSFSSFKGETFKGEAVKKGEVKEGACFTSAEYTARWERILDEIFRKKRVDLKDVFLEGVKAHTKELVFFVLNNKNRLQVLSEFNHKNKKTKRK